MRFVLWSVRLLRVGTPRTLWALGEAIFTEADTLADLRTAAQDAARCHFDDRQSPKVIHLHFERDELIAHKC